MFGKGSVFLLPGFQIPSGTKATLQTRVRIARNTKAPKEVNDGLCHTLSRVPSTRFTELSAATKQVLSRKTESTRTLPAFMILTVAFWLGDHTMASHTHTGG